MIAIIAAALFQVAGASSPVVPHAQPLRGGANAALLDSLQAAELRFFYEWGEAFKQGQPVREDEGYWNSAHEIFVHCRYKTLARNKEAELAEWRAIKSEKSFYSVCPTWRLTDSTVGEERETVDAGLSARARPVVRAVRQTLIAQFDAAAQRFPGNEWIAGQRVRLHLDQLDAGGALTAARECKARATWCNQLLGHVLARRGEIAAAEAAFDAAMRAMPANERCAWTNVGVLLDPPDRNVYDALTCTQRDSIARVLWWLADPLYIEPANERRVEQFSRQVALALRTALDRDERWDWRLGSGGDALRTMVARYGWPTLMHWGGPRNDNAHSGVLLLYRSPMNAPYTTFEYSLGRLQTIPAWSAIADPLRARSTDWTLPAADAPAYRPAEFSESIRNVAEQPPTRGNAINFYWDVVRHVNRWWWPQQHFAPRAPIVQIPDGVVAFLRRQTSAVFATSADLVAATTARANGSVIDATLLVTERPDSIRQVSRASAHVGSPLVLFGNIDARPALAAIEFPSEGPKGPPGGRTRFSIAPPPPLSSMRPGALAISDVILLRAPSDGTALPTDPERAIPHMMGSSRVPRVNRVGVYWETYGFARTDSVEIAVWVERFTPQGIFRQFGNALNLTRDLNTPVVMTWKESGPGTGAHLIPGPVPIIGRSAILDVAALAPGDYWLDVMVRKSGSDPVRTRRSFSVVAQ